MQHDATSDPAGENDELKSEARRQAQRAAEARRKVKRQQRKYPPLAEETRAVVDTDTAAFYLNREPQTLRVWAMSEKGPPPLQPKRIRGRLAWPVSDLRKLTGAE
jgi:hypothetical protein